MQQRAELGQQRHRDEPERVARHVLEVGAREVLELAARLVLAPELGEHERQAAAPAPHRGQPVGVAAHERLEVAVAALRALREERLGIGDDRRDRARDVARLLDGLGGEPLGGGEVAAQVGAHRPVQRVVDEHPRLPEPAGGEAERLDLLLGALRVVELEQQADAPQPHLHPELGVVGALAQLERLERDRQAARHRIRAPHRDEALRERERQRAIGEHAVRRRAARRRAAVDRARQPERLVDELLAALALR